ncbi:sulfotransferase domain-containing protein [Halarcobacter sp.]|uniref:sulfotransferase domain-containing protein n=1 Tax=Halarcobacter sp. TaxID=2321133 RepID=UPI002AAB6748|nr:sulfotransferase domain-containing protein [Halarcobacter sp.]
MKSNLIKKELIVKKFNIPNVRYTISSRSMSHNMNLFSYVNSNFSYLHPSTIESLYGFCEDFSPLYGGRFFNVVNKLLKYQIDEIYKHHKSISLTLTNHFFDEKSYLSSYKILEKFHKAGNSIVCLNDELACKIKKDFPLYSIKASLIKNLNSLEKVKNALEIYDYVVIPMEMNDNDKFLESLPEKNRIILFGNAGCAYNCTSRICYKTVSNYQLKNELSNVLCSKDNLERENLGIVYFDIEKFKEMGFSYFKLIPDPTIKITKTKRRNSKFYIDVIKKIKPIYYLYSYPKCGRTWLRFIIANYISKIYNLNIDIDLNNLFQLMPNLSVEEKKGLNQYNFISDNRFPLIVSSHGEIDIRNNKIFLTRLIYDVIVSEYFHSLHQTKIYDGTISDFIRSEHKPIERYCNYINNMLDNYTDNTFAITYESLQNDILKSLEKLIKFLDLPLYLKELNEAINNSSFENMQNIEKKKGLAGDINTSNDTETLRVRKGKSNAYKEYLNEDDICYIKKICNLELLDKSKEYLKKQKIDYNEPNLEN